MIKRKKKLSFDELRNLQAKRKFYHSLKRVFREFEHFQGWYWHVEPELILDALQPADQYYKVTFKRVSKYAGTKDHIISEYYPTPYTLRGWDTEQYYRLTKRLLTRFIRMSATQHERNVLNLIIADMNTPF